MIANTIRIWPINNLVGVIRASPGPRVGSGSGQEAQPFRAPAVAPGEGINVPVDESCSERAGAGPAPSPPASLASLLPRRLARHQPSKSPQRRRRFVQDPAERLILHRIKIEDALVRQDFDGSREVSRRPTAVPRLTRLPSKRLRPERFSPPASAVAASAR